MFVLSCISVFANTDLVNIFDLRSEKASLKAVCNGSFVGFLCLTFTFINGSLFFGKNLYSGSPLLSIINSEHSVFIDGKIIYSTLNKSSKEISIMRVALQDLKNKIEGRKVFVIGGGPSIKNQDLTPLNKKITICLNSAYSLFENATALYWADDNWASNHHKQLKEHPCKLRFHSRFSVSQSFLEKDVYGPHGCTILRRTGDNEIDVDIDHVRGNNSGAQVLNLLYNCKVRQIVLLGYDMRIKNGQTHWHGGHGLGIKPSVYFNFISSINSMAKYFERVGIKVYNTCMDSELKCFTKKPLEECI